MIGRFALFSAWFWINPFLVAMAAFGGACAIHDFTAFHDFNTGWKVGLFATTVPFVLYFLVRGFLTGLVLTKDRLLIRDFSVTRSIPLGEIKRILHDANTFCVVGHDDGALARIERPFFRSESLQRWLEAGFPGLVVAGGIDAVGPSSLHLERVDVVFALACRVFLGGRVQVDDDSEIDVLQLFPRDNAAVAERLLKIQLAAYGVEATLIGVKSLPPLLESVSDIRASNDAVWGAFDENGDIVAAVFVIENEQGLVINKLVVEPSSFRKGYGRALVEHVLAVSSSPSIRVSTGRENAPARALYRLLEFGVVSESVTSDGVAVVHFERRNL